MPFANLFALADAKLIIVFPSHYRNMVVAMNLKKNVQCNRECYSYRVRT